MVPPINNIDFDVLSEDYAPMKNIDFDGLFQDYTWGTPYEKKLFLCTFFKIMHRILHIDFVYCILILSGSCRLAIYKHSLSCAVDVPNCPIKRIKQERAYFNF